MLISGAQCLSAPRAERSQWAPATGREARLRLRQDFGVSSVERSGYG